MPKKSVSPIINKEIDLTPYKPQTLIPARLNACLAFMVFVLTLVVYLLTNAKSMSFWDCPEYITCSSILGIPHAPGNPFYILLGRFFTIFSFGVDHAVVISFLSSLSAALGVMLTYLITVQLLSMWKEEKFLIFMGGFIAAFLTAFSYTYWANACEAGVYATSALMMNLIIWLSFRWVKRQEDFSHQNYLLLIIYLFFLGFCIHQTILQIAPAILLIILLPYLKESATRPNFWMKIGAIFVSLILIYFIFNSIATKIEVPEMEKFVLGAAIFVMIWWYLREYIDNKLWLFAIALIVIGFSSHLFLLVRSEFRPFINEGHPHNYELFMNYILRKQYGGYSFLERKAPIMFQLNEHFFRYLSWQYLDVQTVASWLKVPMPIIKFFSNVIFLFLGIGGFMYSFKRNKNAFIYILSLLFMTSIAMIFVMNLPTDTPRDRDYFFFQAYNLWAVVMAIGAVGFVRYIASGTNSKALTIIFIALLMGYPIVNMMSGYYKHDRTGELIGLGYGVNILNSLEENAIIFTNGDNDTFPVWYTQAVKDKHVVEFIEPQTNVYPTATTTRLLATAKEWKGSQLAGIRQDVSVANLSLLNTPWYIKQLRDLEGIEINWSDAQIDGLHNMRLGREVEVPVRSPNGERLTVTYERGSVMAVRDYAVAKIIQDNYGKRPIYFAITCSDFSGFDDYLVNEGMVSRIVAEPEFENNVEKLIYHLENVYQYDSVFDNSVYKDQNMVNMIRNYGAAYFRLSDYYHTQELDLDKAIRYYESGLQFWLDKNDRLRLYGMLGVLYAQNEQPLVFKGILDGILGENPNNINLYLIGAYAMFQGDEFDIGFDYIEKGMQQDKSNAQIDRPLLSLLMQSAMQYDMHERGIEIIQRNMDDEDDIKEYLIERLESELEMRNEDLKIRNEE